MDVWDESADRTSQPSRRIRRFHGWKDFALWCTQIFGAVVVAVGLVVALLSSMGFTLSGSKDAIAAIKAGDVVRDSRLSALEGEEPIKLLMLCGLYRKAYPDNVPALCDQAISRAGARK